ncbi:MAG: hypothetical protein FWD06_03215 [Oscillospiraceae bacterium]|nr:hypothetical protein [Oscillospiraceae bacterium]
MLWIIIGSFATAIGAFFAFVMMGHAPNFFTAPPFLLSVAMFIYGMFNLGRWIFF